MLDPMVSLSIFADRIIYTAPGITAKATSRPAMVVVVGTWNTLRLDTTDESHTGRVLLVAPNVWRSITARDSGLYSVQLDSASELCQYLLKQVLKEKRVVDLSNRADDFVMRIAASALNERQDCEMVRAGSQGLLSALFPEAARSQPADARVDAVASWLRTHVPVRTDPRRLAGICGLSESRLAHLFLQETGVAIREYLLWVKMCKAAEMFVADVTLTEIAHSSGFSDLAHLSRTFRRYFDLTPSFLSNPEAVRLQISKEPVGRN
ncbi:AraC family transcriptional regulator [Paraburkholderia sp. CNPSo 3272]|uniref:helix-turn-helix transcriptional regulator n=1 Tax=Paraburkholderia sp. CNPSo 3272 TaxID=2940931 RepID=UPI0020B7C75A|nr:AraC family transcriptional regulator [Paraburkholderia sp. CNPSo 3272]MCP3725134.1 AraC family transcriptional regulator [Paraburkholderia sp. CNPSo 3272]